MNVYYDSIPSEVKVHSIKRTFQATTKIGPRPTQEDRLLLCPKFIREEASFCAVFDGTVGHDASHFIQTNIVKHLSNVEGIKSEDLFDFNQDSAESIDNYADKVTLTLKSAFLKADEHLLEHCAKNQLHYSSSTGVAAFIYKNILSIAHIGDSKACIARAIDGMIQPEWLTIDHKPNMPNELNRIERSGGSLVWLNGNKPYIR